MRLFLTGIGCVGKSTIGLHLSKSLGCSFFDLDDEIEKFFATPIEKLQNKYLTMNSFREEASKALVNILNKKESKNSIIALPPSGLMCHYWRVIKKTKGITIVLNDQAKNILNRIIFFDKNSIQIEKVLTEEDKKYYLKEIKKDITYYKKSYERADISIDITNLDITKSMIKVLDSVEQYRR